MDPVEQAVPQTEQAAPASEPPQEPEPVHQVCKNCGYHDVSGGPPARCPACYFRHNSQPVDQAPVKKEEPKPQEPSLAKEPSLEPEAKVAAEEAPTEPPVSENSSQQGIVQEAPAQDAGEIQDAGKAAEEKG